MTIFDSAKNLAAGAIGRNLLVAKKYAPAAMTGLGVVGVVGAAVLASKSTLKLSPVIDGFVAEHSLVAEVRAAKDTVEYPEAMHRSDVVKVYVRAGLKLAQLYGPSVGLGVVSIGLIVGGQDILWKRNAALGAAYSGLHAAYQQYRARVSEEYGPEKEREFYNAERQQTVHETVDGKKTERVATVSDPNQISVYAKFFDPLNPNWKKDREMNLMFLRQVQNHMNDLLQIRGHVFLNNVYDALGIPRTSAGQLCGWVRGGDGDDFVDFGIYDGADPCKVNFVNGYEDGILLNFNVDGVVYDLI